MSLPFHLSESLIANRCINISSGKNNNLALDEYVEILNRDTKDTCSRHQTKESIIISKGAKVRNRYNQVPL